jgi:hypothetical protein
MDALQQPIQMEKPSQKLYLLGEVVETFERKGQKLAKVSLKSWSLEMAIEPTEELHLGDSIAIEVCVTGKRVMPEHVASPPHEKP